MRAPLFHPCFRLLLCALFVLAAHFGLEGTTQTTLQIFALPLTPKIQMALIGGGALAAIGIVALCRNFLDGRGLASLGLRGRRCLPDFCAGAFCGGALLVSLLGVLWIAGCVDFGGISMSAQKISPTGIALRLAAWAAVIGLAAVGEELCFRGYGLHNLAAWLGTDRTGLGAAAILQGGFFALVHLFNFGANPSSEQIGSTWQALPNIALIGIFFALCAYKTGSLWFPIGFHAAWNFLQGCVVSLPVSGLRLFHFLDVNLSGSPWLTGGSFGVEGSLLLTVFTLALIAVVRREADHPQLLADIASLLPREESEGDVEVASRAPRQRLRKEIRLVKAMEKPTFEGWNDMEPASRAPYRTFTPGSAEPAAAPEDVAPPMPETVLEEFTVTLPEPAPVALTAEPLTITTPPAAPLTAPTPTPSEPLAPLPATPKKPAPRW